MSRRTDTRTSYLVGWGWRVFLLSFLFFLLFLFSILWYPPAWLVYVSISLLSVGFESCCSDLGLWLLQCLLWSTLAHINTVRHMVEFWGCPVQGGSWTRSLWVLFNQEYSVIFLQTEKLLFTIHPPVIILASFLAIPCIQWPLDNDISMMYKADNRQTLLWFVLAWCSVLQRRDTVPGSEQTVSFVHSNLEKKVNHRVIEVGKDLQDRAQLSNLCIQPHRAGLSLEWG